MHQMDGPTRGAFLHLATVALWLTSQSRHRSMVQGGSSNQALRKTLLCWQTSPFSKAEAQKRACKLLSENDARSGCEEWRRPTDGPGPESMTSTKSKPLLEFRVHVCVCVCGISTTSSLIPVPCLHSGSRTPQGKAITCVSTKKKMLKCFKLRNCIFNSFST